LPTAPVSINVDERDSADTVPPSSPLIKPVTNSQPIDFKKYAVVVAIDFGR
jgi:hypothetical protein